MLEKKVSTARRLLQEKGLRAAASHGRFKLKARRCSVRLESSKFGLEGIHGVSEVTMLTNLCELLPERRVVARYLRRDLPVVELEGSIGVVACVTNRIPHIERNGQLNRCKVEIMNRAIGYASNTVTFRPSSDVCGNSVTSAGDDSPVTIPTAQLRDLLRHRGFSRFALVCDIEGIEYELVCHEADVSENADPIIMETHARLMGEHKLSSMMTRLQNSDLESLRRRDLWSFCRHNLFARCGAKSFRPMPNVA